MEYYCPNCGNTLNNQTDFNPNIDTYKCPFCSQLLVSDKLCKENEEDCIVHFCDKCGAVLNSDEHFSSENNSHICSKCFHETDISENNIFESEDEYKEHLKKIQYAEKIENTKEILSITGKLIYAAYKAREYKHEQYSFNPDKVKREELSYTPSDEEIIQFKKIRRKAFFRTKKQIPIGYDSSYLLTKSVGYVRKVLIQQAYMNVIVKPIYDVYIDSKYQYGQIDNIKIGNKLCFSKNDTFPYTIDIIISYHEKKQIKITSELSTLKKQKYNTVYNRFAKLGFTEIYTKPLNNLIKGWLHKPSEIKNIYIAGKNYFNKGDSFDYDSRIVIEYYSYPK